jgi:hypothetical protein
VGFQCRVQVVQHNAGFHFDGALGNVHGQDLRTCLLQVDHQAGTHRLAALAGAAAPGTMGTPRSRQMSSASRHVGTVARHKHAHGHLLVDRGIGGVAAAVGRGEQHLTLGFGGQAQRPGRPATSLLARAVCS